MSLPASSVQLGDSISPSVKGRSSWHHALFLCTSLKKEHSDRPEPAPFPLGPSLESRLQAHGRFSHQAFYYKVPESLSGHPLPAQRPWALGQAQRRSGPVEGACAGKKKADSLEALLGCLSSGTVISSVVEGAPRDNGVLCTAAAIHSWRVRRFLIYKSFLIK